MNSEKKIPLLKKGRIELNSLNNEYIASKAYTNPSQRINIINSWKKRYPNKSFYVIFKPQID